MDMDPENEKRNTEQKPRQASTGWKSCLLLVVMLIGVFTTPLALLYRWYEKQPDMARALNFDGGQEQINRIVFITLDQQLATISPDGENIRLLAELPDRLTFPAWSPDGSRLAVALDSRIFLFADEEPESLTITKEPIYDDAGQSPFYVYWSPDSTKLSFLTNHPDGLALQIADVSEGRSATELVAIGQPFYWDWSREGDSLLIHSGLLGNNARLALIDNHGEGQDIARPGFFQAPGFSASGRLKAFAEIDQTRISHLIVQDDDGKEIVSVPHSGQISMLWNPIDELLATSSPASDRSGSYGPLSIIDPSNNHIEQITQDNVVAYFWSPDGKKIAYFTPSGQDLGGVQALSLPAKGDALARTHNQGGNLKLDLWVADVQSLDKRQLLRFTPSSAFMRQFLPYFDQYALSHRIWSPDSNDLIMPIVEEGVSHIAIIPVGQGDIQFLSAGEIGFWSQQ